jgi:GNAT superfamily N-acetyltransferase
MKNISSPEPGGEVLIHPRALKDWIFTIKYGMIGKNILLFFLFLIFIEKGCFLMIRKLTPADRDVYLQFTEAFYASDAVMTPVPRAFRERTFDMLMQTDTYASGYLFEWDGRPVGYALTAKTYSQEAGGMVVWIEELFILPDCRSRGLGSAFFTYLMEVAEPDAARFRLEVEQENEGAVRLYHRRGFQRLPYDSMVVDRILDWPQEAQ